MADDNRYSGAFDDDEMDVSQFASTSVVDSEGRQYYLLSLPVGAGERDSRGADRIPAVTGGDKKSTQTKSTPAKLMFDTTYVTSASSKNDYIDEYALGLLKSRFEKTVVPFKMKPLTTLGDGSCFLHAVSTYLMGWDAFDGELRQLIVKEVIENKQFYMDTLVASQMELYKEDEDLKDEEKKHKKMEDCYEELVESCKGKVNDSDSLKQNWVGLHEAFILANAIKRPIIIYASQQDVSEHGESINGVGGAFLPLRHQPRDCVSKSPILISWSFLGYHFSPLVHVAGWDAGDGRVEFPMVRPVLVENYPLGSPVPKSNVLSEKEMDAMKVYVDYYEKVKEPPTVASGGVSGVAAGGASPATSRIGKIEIPGFVKTINPDDGLEYDIVIPVDVGFTVVHVAFNFGEDYNDKVDHIVANYCDSSEVCKEEILLYIARVLNSIRIIYHQRNRLGSSEIPKLCDFVPTKLTPSIPVVNKGLQFVAESLSSESVVCVPSIPIKVPCRFTEYVSDKGISELIDSTTRRCGNFSNAYVESLYGLLDFMRETFLNDRSGMLALKCDIRHDNVLMKLAECSDYKSFGLFDLLRYLALNPIYCGMFGRSLISWCNLPTASDPLCVHIAFVRMMANIFSCLYALDNTITSYDVSSDVVEWKEFIHYFDVATKTKSLELLLSLSVLFLDIAAMNNFSPLNVVVARYYPRILLNALRLKHQPLIRNILMGMATLMYNDRNANDTLASCKPLDDLLSQAEAIVPENVTPYVNFCKTALMLDDLNLSDSDSLM